MTLDPAIAEAGRTDAARHLIEQAQDDPVELVTVSALELCVLGAPRHPLFEEMIARAWIQMGNRRRKKAIESVTEGMVKRGLLIHDSPRTGFQQQGSTYSLKPQLGLMLAARSRPSLIITTEREGKSRRTPQLFALGDQAEPVRGIVVELPAALPPELAGSFPNVAKLGPLGWFYRYVLVSPDKAAEILAALTISPSQGEGETAPSGYLVSAYHPGTKTPSGYRLRVRGDGTKARLDGQGAGDGGRAGAECDIDGLRAVMLDLITGLSP